VLFLVCASNVSRSKDGSRRVNKDLRGVLPLSRLGHTVVGRTSPTCFAYDP